MIRTVDENSYRAFIQEGRFTVIHFDASWDVGYRQLVRDELKRAETMYGQQVNFGEVDIDLNQKIAGTLPVLNVPLIAYYRETKLIKALIGVNQNITGKVAALIEGKPIEYEKGLKPQQQRP